MSFDFNFTPSRGPDRSACLRQGQEAVRITGHGGYVTPSGQPVDLGAAVDAAVAGTVDHRPEEAIALPTARGPFVTKVRVENGTSLAAARRLAGILDTRADVLVLNFASAKNPGGGFLNGARAQEESLARSSALYATIRSSPMYAFHRGGSLLYSDWMIWSPRVPVFRDDTTEALLETPYLASFLTAPAPNAGMIRHNTPAEAGAIEPTLRARVTRTLAVAALHGHTKLVLGAWGCGVFQNDPAIVADAYARDLEGAFAGVFDEVVFAVLDWSADRHFVRPFVARFG